VSVPARVSPAARDSKLVRLSPSRHVQDTGLLPTFGQPGCLIAPVAVLPHDRAILAVAAPRHPGTHAPPHAACLPRGGPPSRQVSRLRQAHYTQDNRFKPVQTPGTPATAPVPSHRSVWRASPQPCRTRAIGRADSDAGGPPWRRTAVRFWDATTPPPDHRQAEPGPSKLSGRDLTFPGRLARQDNGLWIR
jgi:hypothetical protein